jgi:YVTN family beta-propeller protein
VPTIVLASAGVKAGYQDAIRSTHYSLLRTIEAALGLGTLTANDRYAQPLNGIFDSERTSFSAPQPAVSTSVASLTAAPLTAAHVTPPGTAGFLAAAASARDPVAWVANYASNTVSPVNVATRKAGPQIPAGSGPRAVVATPDGTTVYVADSLAGTVTPIAAGTGKPGKPIPVGAGPWALAMTAYVVNTIDSTVTPVDTRTGTSGAPLNVGAYTYSTAIMLAGQTAVVVEPYGYTVTLIDTKPAASAPRSR